LCKHLSSGEIEQSALRRLDVCPSRRFLQTQWVVCASQALIKRAGAEISVIARMRFTQEKDRRCRRRRRWRAAQQSGDCVSWPGVGRQRHALHRWAIFKIVAIILEELSPTVQVSKCLCRGSEQESNAAGSPTRTAPATPETIYCGTQSIVSPSVFAASALKKDNQCASLSVATWLLCSLKQTCVLARVSFGSSARRSRWNSVARVMVQSMTFSTLLSFLKEATHVFPSLKLCHA